MRATDGGAANVGRGDFCGRGDLSLARWEDPRTFPHDRMDAAEYANISSLEAEHWYYSGKRRFVREWIQKVRPPGLEDVLLDCGAGTGRFAEEMSAQCRVFVLDDHEEALKLLHQRFRPEQIFSLAGDRIPLPDGSLEYVTALDVLEHVPDDRAVVSGFHRLLKPGGIAVVTVPASRALWSDWDVALHHFRRYDRAELRALFPTSEWEVLHVNYTNVLAFPVVWAVRKWRVWRRSVGMRPSGRQRSEDRVPARALNALLRAQLVRLAHWRVPFPFGVGLILVARRRA